MARGQQSGIGRGETNHRSVGGGKVVAEGWQRVCLRRRIRGEARQAAEGRNECKTPAYGARQCCAGRMLTLYRRKYVRGCGQGMVEEGEARMWGVEVGAYPQAVGAECTVNDG